MGELWSDLFRFKTWLQVEFAVIAAKISLKKVRNPKQVDKELQLAKRSCEGEFPKIKIDPAAIDKIEAEVTKHDVMAFVRHITDQLKQRGFKRLLPLFHQGLTSYDIVDTALSIVLVKSIDIIIEDMRLLIKVIKEKAFMYRKTLEIGRTHGIHAEPITFGFKLLNYADQLERSMDRLFLCHENLSVGKISGAVGTYANIDPRIEESVCNLLFLQRARISTQILARDRHAEFVCLMAIIGSTLDNIATELRNLQRTEIGEVEEEFVRGQKGSSAMPHKRNPIGPENISSQARILRGYAVTALENIVSWHERDLANSANERVILADSAIIVDYCLVRLTGIIKKLTVNEWRMQRNLELTGGMIYSQKVMLALTKKGMAREDAHTLVQNLCWDSHDDPEGPTFKERVYADKRIKKLVTRKQLDQCFDPKQDLKNIPAIFARFQ
jgi:adenylosuccinate lyase